MELFTEDDFKTQTAWATHSKSLAAIANKKLKELIEASTVVFCDQDELHFSGNEEVGYTHKGYLVGVEEIKKECQNHIPTIKSKQVSLPQASDPYAAALVLGCEVVCLNCGKSLVAEWKVR
jgi:predicted translin family RNA/ssDNA-binding protein